MAQCSSTIIVKRALGGLFIWFIAASISCGVSTSIANYFAKKTLAESSILGILINVFLVIFGIMWLIISVAIFYNILRILRRHALLPPSNVRIRKLDEEEVIQFIKDVI